MASDAGLRTTRDLMSYIGASPTAAHAVVESAKRLDAAGFRRVDEGDRWDLASGDRFYAVRNDVALMAGQVGTEPPAEAGFRVVGAHTDSPGFRIKYHGQVAREGFLQLGVEVYGGPLLASWADRDLGIAGRVVVKGDDGQPTTRLLRLDRPLARIPLPAIHLNREVNDKGMVLDRQRHLPPVIGLAGADGKDDGRLMALVADAAGVHPDEVLGSTLELVDLQAPTLAGLDEVFYFSPRIDNLAGCHAALEALLDDDDPAPFGRVIALFHSEEVGSSTAEGAGSSFLASVLERLAGGGERPREDYLRALSRSILASVDGAHGVHPSHADRHEPEHKPGLNGGPVVKINAMERYATTAVGDAHLDLCAARDGVPLQRYIHRTDLPCGSTIGPLSSTQLGMTTVDLGVPMISMHSVREMGGTEDQEWMVRLLAAHLGG